ncbi:hypothetical protein SteCoe_32499 [Stentor coeruleus]|uniref:protein-tyrosine-phosphatase n=1 Tax=Stentor coeruleus TaxID=5963 RepID=A0A1R2AYV6_9CILI|nr:hypothetical protein SteCoe_32499 [Stentor coeruleus]
MSTYNFHQIIPGLFISDSPCASNINFLLDKSISHILICAKELNPKFPKDFNYRKLDILDTKRFNLKPYFDEAIRFIQSALNSRENVLVHCNLGISRSPSIVIAYLIYQCDMSYSKAFRYISKLHPTAYPNPSFVKQLKIFESNRKELKKKTCMCLVM